MAAVPFRSPAFAFRELSERLPRAAEAPLRFQSYGRAAIAPVREEESHPLPARPYTAYDVERAIRERARVYGEETPRDRLFRWGQCFALVLAIAFVATVVVLMAILAIRLSNAVDGLGGEGASEKVNAMMDLALEGAQNARAASRNVLHVTEQARSAASVAAPRLVQAVNETSGLVDDLRSWSFHPSLQIAPGTVGASAGG
ncbi:MAG: hypothetical protein CMI29_06675 [Opitutae bacterium]|nr:hypothetical protein [Opitutae bacterium]|tara:strand:- start:560 stop:1162 length:603 start_codon:yes stop_codon:yes gene_type:complete